MARALIALGSNLGDRQVALDAAAEAVGRLPSTRLLAKSAWLESVPVGGPPNQPAFLNGAVLIETAIEPVKLLERLHQIEGAAGRLRGPHWGPRTLDLDLLLYDERSIATDRLTLPHPRMVFRRFVLEPAAQIAAHMVHPATGMTVEQLLENLNDAPPYLAILGPPASGKTRLASEVARQSRCRLLLDHDTGSPVQTMEASGLKDSAGQSVLPLNQGDAKTVAASALKDSAGREPAREIEFLARRAQLLAPSDDRPNWTISDFWLPQSIAWAEAEGGEPWRSQVEAAWQESRQGTPQARFVAALDLATPPGVRSEAVARPGDLQERLRTAMRRLASQRGQPPVVWLSSDDWNGAVAEIMAILSG